MYHLPRSGKGRGRVYDGKCIRSLASGLLSPSHSTKRMGSLSSAFEKFVCGVKCPRNRRNFSRIQDKRPIWGPCRIAEKPIEEQENAAEGFDKIRSLDLRRRSDWGRRPLTVL